ncbi:hypothetical protein [Flavobacterium sp. N1736]|uniref:hypothetical protein n=1 Tax=Flavobacterium sp. N1736 TaxID=2986823 RepID=UPI00222493E5|nr:hypothetical protein [Flavobacterium sp. N1736]
MKIVYLYLFLFPISLLSQSFYRLENNDNLKKYRSVENKKYFNNKKSAFSSRYILEDGKIKEVETFNKSSLVYKSEYNYDLKKNVVSEIIKFNINKGQINDTIKYSYVYNSSNQLIEKKCLSREYYSNFNSQNLPQTIEFPKTKMDSLTSYKVELLYNSFGAVLEQKVFSKYEGKSNIEINNYVYDVFKNVIEVKRKSIPEETYPIIIAGGRSKYKEEKYRYVYNKDNLWIKKYWIIENKEYLIEKRKFKKE